jgi:hypothetical protein
VAAWRLGLLACTLYLIGCFRVELGAFHSPPQLRDLVEASSNPLPLSVTYPLSDSSHGYQFLLGVIPVTRVFPDDLNNLVIAKLAMYAGFSRYGVEVVSPSEKIIPRLEVVIQEVAVNGYDLVVTRRPSASITLSGTLRQVDGHVRECRATGSFAEFSRFAFAEDLKLALEKAADKAAQDLLECLGLFSKSEFQSIHGIALQ